MPTKLLSRSKPKMTSSVSSQGTAQASSHIQQQINNNLISSEHARNVAAIRSFERKNKIAMGIVMLVSAIVCLRMTLWSLAIMLPFFIYGAVESFTFVRSTPRGATALRKMKQSMVNNLAYVSHGDIRLAKTAFFVYAWHLFLAIIGAVRSDQKMFHLNAYVSVVAAVAAVMFFAPVPLKKPSTLPKAS